MAGAVLHFCGITSLNDVIIPKLMRLFTLNIGGLWLPQGIHAMNDKATLSRNERQSSGQLHHPLWQYSENFTLPVGARTTPFSDLREQPTTASAIAFALIECTDIDAR